MRIQKRLGVGKKITSSRGLSADFRFGIHIHGTANVKA